MSARVVNVKRKMIHQHEVPISFKGGEWEYETQEIEVQIMGVSGRYAMVRRKGCFPYVVLIKELRPNP